MTKPRIVRWILPTSSLPSRLPLDLLPPAAQTAATRFHQPADRRLAVGSQLLQRVLILQSLDRSTAPSIESIELWKDAESGRPGYVPPKQTGASGEAAVLCDYNVSHHSQLVVLAGLYIPESAAAGSNIPTPLIGVDVVPTEIPSRQSRVDPSEFLESFTCESAQIFTPLEIKIIMAPPTWAKRVKMFYLHWSLKEAYVKAVGTGLVTDLTKIEFRNVKAFDHGDEQVNGKRVRKRNTDVTLYLDGVLQSNWYLEVEEYKTDDWGSEDSAVVGEYYLAIAMKLLPRVDVDVNGNWEELDYERDILPWKKR
ncbi:hypothetical protein DFH27DRAFT_252541 [Peziza echinospora]|nr:hypothetical protein DFH27DRAFT_252541 [Peziza echinospora]